MPKKKEIMMLEVMEPDYMDAFFCNGLFCPDTCCKGWDIVIDEASCRRYEKSHDAEFKAMLSRAIIHRQEAGDDGGADIAYIRMGREHRCLFLCNDGLCRIQRRTNERNLSETCRTYPRVIYQWADGIVQRALCVSCPEAARLILARKEVLHFVTKKIVAEEFNGLRISGQGRLGPFCLPLRQFMIRILQERRLPLTRRLQLADEFFWQAGDLARHRGEKKFLHLQDIYEQKLQSEMVSGVQAADLVPSVFIAAEQLGCIRELLFQRLQNPALRMGFRRQVEAALGHWQLESGKPLSWDGVQHYIEDRELYQLLLLPEHGRLLENYLVNEVFKEIFVTEDGEAFYLGWFRLLLQFALVRALLLAALADPGAVLTQESIIEKIQQTSRVIGHDAHYMSQMAKLLATDEPEACALQLFCRNLVQPLFHGAVSA